MPDFNLTPRQELAARALAEGLTATAAALKAGVSRRTLYTWQENLPDFTAAVGEFRKERRELIARHAESNLALANGTIAAILSDETVSLALRAEAALAVLSAGKR